MLILRSTVKLIGRYVNFSVCGELERQIGVTSMRQADTGTTGTRLPGRRGRPAKTDGASNAAETILDSAELEFSRHGYDGVSQRMIARRASVDVALLHYYFDTKKGLFDAVFMRRAEILNRERLARLDAYEAERGDAMTLEGLMDAFLAPVLVWSASTDAGWRNYFSLIAQVSNTPEWGGETMARYFDPVVQRLIALVRRVLPQAADTDLYWSYHMLSGALMLTLSETGRIDRLSGGICRSDDMTAARERMVPFAAAGFRAACRVP